MNAMKKIVIIIVLLGLASWGCRKDTLTDSSDQKIVYTQIQDPVKTIQLEPTTCSKENCAGLFEFRDFDGNVYHAIQIGQQIWSKENLRTTHYNDGTLIPYIQDDSQWKSQGSGAFCMYDNAVNTVKKYGLLYNFYAASSGKIAPKGWHVATFEDWSALLNTIGTKFISGDIGPLVEEGEWSEAFYVWSIDEPQLQKLNWTNSTLFTALPNGFRGSVGGQVPQYSGCGVEATWWSWNIRNQNVLVSIEGTFGINYGEDAPNTMGSGIRLVKDAEP
jgi:uncharacterized protein (TIGR02145 family)